MEICDECKTEVDKNRIKVEDSFWNTYPHVPRLLFCSWKCLAKYAKKEDEEVKKRNKPLNTKEGDTK